MNFVEFCSLGTEITDYIKRVCSYNRCNFNGQIIFLLKRAIRRTVSVSLLCIYIKACLLFTKGMIFSEIPHKINHISRLLKLIPTQF